MLRDIEMNGVRLPDLGVWVFDDQIAIDYRMGPRVAFRATARLFSTSDGAFEVGSESLCHSRSQDACRGREPFSGVLVSVRERACSMMDGTADTTALEQSRELRPPILGGRCLGRSR